METIKFETEEDRRFYERMVIRLCREKDCLVAQTYTGLIWPKFCTPACECRQKTEAAAQRAVETLYGHTG